MKKTNLAQQHETRRWIRTIYLHDNTITQLQRSFHEQQQLPHLRLHDFLAQHEAMTLLHYLKKATSTSEIIPDRHSLQLITITKELQQFLTFLASPLFRDYLQQITHSRLAGSPDIQLLRFEKEIIRCPDQDARKTHCLLPLSLLNIGSARLEDDAYLEGAEEPLLLYPTEYLHDCPRDRMYAAVYEIYQSSRAASPALLHSRPHLIERKLMIVHIFRRNRILFRRTPKYLRYFFRKRYKQHRTLRVHGTRHCNNKQLPSLSYYNTLCSLYYHYSCNTFIDCEALQRLKEQWLILRALVYYCTVRRLFYRIATHHPTFEKNFRRKLGNRRYYPCTRYIKSHLDF